MAQIPFFGPTYSARSGNFSAQRCINLYPELDEGGAKGKVVLYGTPGCNVSFVTPNGQPVRGQHVFNGTQFFAAGNTFYSRSTAGTITALGTVSTSSGPVCMENNGLASAGIGGNQVIIIDGVSGYIYNVATGIFSQIASDFPGAVGSVTFIDGYFIVSDISGMMIHVSELYDGTTWSALAYSPASAAQDNVKAILNLQQQLFIIKEFSTELWSDAGVPTSQGCPFQRVPGSVLDFGTPAPASVVKAGSNVFCVGNMRVNGVGQFAGILEVSGYAPVVISPPDIVYQMSQFPTVADAFSFVQSDSGHVFVWFTFPSGDATFIYDLKTRMWHERSTANTSSYQVNRHVAQTYAFFNGGHYVSDPVNGNVYVMGNQYLSDFGNPLISVRRAPCLGDNQNMNMVGISRLRIDCETGVGTLQPNVPASAHAVVNGDGTIGSIVVDTPGADYVSLPVVSLSGDAGTGAVLTPVVVNGQLQSVTVVSPGTGYTAPDVDIAGPIITPTAVLSWSDNGGKTWSDDYPRSMGNAGEYDTVLEFRGLGKTRLGRIFQLSVSDPVKKAFFGAHIHG